MGVAAKHPARPSLTGLGMMNLRNFAKTLPALLSLAFVYWFFAHFGLKWANTVGVGSPIWPAAGVALAGLALGGLRLWPAIFLARIAVALTLDSSNPPLVVLGIAAGNTLAAALPVLLLQRARVDLRLATMPDVMWIIGASALSAVFGASFGTLSLALGDALPSAGPWVTWSDWLYGNFDGAVLAAPLIIAWARNGLGRVGFRTAFHIVVSLIGVGVLSCLIFLNDEPSPWRTWHLFPVLAWAGLAFQVRGAATALLVASSIAVLGVSMGVGPFMTIGQLSGQPAEMLTQQFIGLTGSTILTLAAAADERRTQEALRRSAAELDRQKTELETLYAEAPVGMALLDRDLRYLRVNQAMAKINGQAVGQTLGRTVSEVLPGLAPKLSPLYDRTFTTGEAVTNVPVEGVVYPHDGGLRQWLVSSYPVLDESGVKAVSCVVQDITEQRKAAETERMLAREVDHRAKNLLAVVQSVVQLTRADTLGAYRAAILGRIQALGRVHSVLAAERWRGVDLRRLVSEELEPFKEVDRHVHISGPHLRLRPAAAQSLALVIHELATNAAKYGALTTPGADLHISWTLAGGRNGRLHLRWRESGGPPVTAPARLGFGSTVLRASVERQLKGAVNLNWDPAGLVCDLIVPADQLELDGRDRAPADPAEARVGHENPLTAPDQ